MFVKSTYVDSPRVNMATVCTDISAGLRNKMLRDARSNKFKNEIVHILDNAAANAEISNFFFTLDDYKENLIADLDICTKTRYVLNYLLFSNFASKYTKIGKLLAADSLVSLSGFYYLFFVKAKCVDRN